MYKLNDDVFKILLYIEIQQNITKFHRNITKL